MARKLTLFDKALIVSGLSALTVFALYVFVMNRPPRQYYIPKDFSGWVTIKYEKPDAPPLEEKNGYLQINIPSNGIFETSSKLESGWSRDEHYWNENGKTILIPKSVGEADNRKRYVHDDLEENMAIDSILMMLPVECDTTLWDGTRISKRGEKADVRSGRKVLQHFFVTAEPAPFFFEHDSLPDTRRFW